MSWPGRVLNLFRRRRLDADIEEELQFHLEARTRDNVAAGMTPDDARRDARRRFGSPLHAREASRDANVVLWLETFILDLRYAARGLRKSPAVTAIAVLSLGLAIGANTAIFSLLNAVLLKPLPYRDAGRIAILWTTNALNGAREQNTSVPNLQDWKAQSRTFEDLAAYRESDGLLADPGDPTRETEWTGYAWVSTPPCRGRSALRYTRMRSSALAPCREFDPRARSPRCSGTAKARNSGCARLTDGHPRHASSGAS